MLAVRSSGRMAATSLSTPERFVLMQCVAVCYGVLQFVSVSRVID